MRIDARIPVHFLDALPEAGTPDQLLVVTESFEPPPRGWAAVLRLADHIEATPPAAAEAIAGHRSGCRCCTPTPRHAAALARMFHARARGEVDFFRSVTVHLPPRHAVSLRDIIVSDPFVSGRFVTAP